MHTINLNENVQETYNKIKREKTYIFYFFTYFKPKSDFFQLYVDGNDWGRFDILSIKQYKTDKLYWVIQLFNPNNEFWNMKYNYSIFIPDKSDIERYIELINSLIFKD